MRHALTAYDGWALAYAPFSPAALHLLAILEVQASPSESLVLLPAPPVHPLPERVNGFLSPERHSPIERLKWEQFSLPRLAAGCGAGEICLVTPTPPLWSHQASRCSPAQWGRLPPTRSLRERLRRSLAFAGMHSLQRLDWPADLPAPADSFPLQRLRPFVHPLFRADGMDQSGPGPLKLRSQSWPAPGEIPFLLYSGPFDPAALHLLMAGWSWATPALGPEILLILPRWTDDLPAARPEDEFLSTVRQVQPETLEGLAWLYRQAAAVIQLGPNQPWGDPALLALAAHRPLVALEEPAAAARAGPAAFLVPPANARLLGAALVSLLSDDSLAASLNSAAANRAAGWAQLQ